MGSSAAIDGGRSWPGVLGTLTAEEDLDPADARWAMSRIMEGVATDAQIAAFGVALKMKGVTGPELEALASTMLDYSRRVPTDRACVDIVGTGGDRQGTVNISTMSSLVVSACGVPVVKHGNRAASSKSGGADVLEALGVAIDLGPEDVGRCLDEVGVAFCFAPVFHPALRFAATPRREIGIPTVFNILGPLTNPAAPTANLIGCAFENLVSVMAEVFALRGRSALVVRGTDGLDEITMTGPTRVLRVAGGHVDEDRIEPADFGMNTCSIEELRGGDGVYNAGVARDLLAGKTGPVRDAVLLNSAAALVAFDGLDRDADLVAAMRAAVDRAATAIDDGEAARLLEKWVGFSANR
ncbi:MULTISPECIES: anthranilate phosphoribosyltransferase [Dietzia]|uniref:Anthranilate phosphoribosyltransferase n=1 Tax=Dietzia cinnamea TaxID=321318 RepID=A0AAW5Q5M9_9ACTN|nr:MULTISPECIES: anthranilate phosphoribosyltransferase [Dietzia]PWD97120.1 anthranilate phosphoribosyltransferase [Dietzia maris]MBM7231115.1 anthranilate phosphoribosyltransferase [Dietzia cinnamea]MCT1863772.1 anthranilate phosphoribosyltransferase [Dietzia cinnamea]MCT2029919.1 anthranilate phosphoribosyltransferase [Dietzia cinnamea]MCT2032903.1 anthranilate phosphoribosyltransferase [Dietzia cinnamea]